MSPDDLAVRASLTVAALLILATGLSVLQLVRGDAVRDAASDLARHVATQLDVLGRAEGELTVRIGHDGSGTLSMPTSLAGAEYQLEVRAKEVRVVVSGATVVVPLREPVHPFAPDAAAYSSTALAALDARSVTVVEARDSLWIDRMEMSVDGVPAYLTFVYLPD